MSELQNTAKDTEKRHGLTVIEGGKPKKGGKEPPPGNWLRQLPPGTVFLVKPLKDATPLLTEYHLMGHRESVTMLVDARKKGKSKYTWVETIPFSESFALVEVLGSYQG